MPAAGRGECVFEALRIGAKLIPPLGLLLLLGCKDVGVVGEGALLRCTTSCGAGGRCDEVSGQCVCEAGSDCAANAAAGGAGGAGAGNDASNGSGQPRAGQGTDDGQDDLQPDEQGEAGGGGTQPKDGGSAQQLDDCRATDEVTCSPCPDQLCDDGLDCLGGLCRDCRDDDDCEDAEFCDHGSCEDL